VSDERGKLTHVGPSGQARMVDVTDKKFSTRTARASGSIRMTEGTLSAIVGSTVGKGDVIGVARLAGIMAAKRTSELIPLCHSLPLTDVQVAIEPDDSLPGLRAEAVVRTVGPTGVEMEAITAVAIALVTVYDMAKAIDRNMVISDICLESKEGGRSGSWQRG
jgi:cyclic pyranopterin phosphate synthase